MPATRMQGTTRYATLARYPGTTVEAVAVLLLMHLVVVATAVGILTRTWHRISQPTRSRS